MAVCPWCKAVVPNANDTCPRCGKHPADHPSISGGNFSSIGSFEDFDDAPPALEVDTGGVVAHSGGVDTFDDNVGMGMGQAFDDDSFDDDPLAEDTSGAKLDVSISRPLQAPSRSPTPSPPIRRQAISQGDAPSPTEEPTSSVDEYEARVLAKFGPVPETWWQAPLYTLTVWRRRKVLRNLLEQASLAARDTTSEVDRWLETFGRQVWPQVRDTPSAGDLNEPLKDLEQTIAERTSRFEEAESTVSEQIHQLQGELERAQQAAAHSASELADARRAFDEQDLKLRRALAKKKRAEIELRNAMSVAQSQGKRLTDAERTPLEQRVNEATERLQAPQTSWNEAHAVLDEKSLAHREDQKAIAELQRRIAVAMEAHDEEMATRSEGIREATSKQSELMRNLAARVLKAQPDLVPEDQLDAFKKLQSSVAQLEQRAHLIEAAIESANPEAMARGRLVIFLAAGLMGLLLIGFVSMLVRSEPPPSSADDPKMWETTTD